MLRVIKFFTTPLKVVENATSRKLGYDFLFAFHAKNGIILYHFRDIARHLSKIAIFSYHCIRRPRRESPPWNIATTFRTANIGVYIQC